jgi:hypothetical protein
MRNRVFFPQAALDDWVGDNRADIRGEDLSLRVEGRRYRIIEAVRVMREVTGADDPHELLGRVKTRAFLTELGAEMLENSMILGDNAYDVIQGFVGAPIGAFADYKKANPPTATHDAKSDEELLYAFMSGAAEAAPV